MMLKTKKKNKILCPRCNKEEAVIDTGLGVLPGERCQAEDEKLKFRSPEFYIRSKQERITRDRDLNAKDILQPWVGRGNKPNPDFVKAYPLEARNYFTKKELQKI